MFTIQRYLFALLLGFLIVTGCDSFQTSQSIELEDGRKASYRIDTDGDNQQRTLVVRVDGRESMKRESQIRKDAFGIWQQLKTVAEKLEIEEGLMTYVVVGVDGKQKRFLFTAEQTETGDWLVRSAN